MAKSIHSKSQQRNRAKKQQTIFRPAVSAREQRIAARSALALVEAEGALMATEPLHGFRAEAKGPSSLSTDLSQDLAASCGDRKQSRKTKKGFNPYGIPPKETRF